MIQELKEQVLELRDAKPFRPYAIVLDTGEELVIRRPAGIALHMSPESLSFGLFDDHGLRTGEWDRVMKVVVLEDQSVHATS